MKDKIKEFFNYFAQKFGKTDSDSGNKDVIDVITVINNMFDTLDTHSLYFKIGSDINAFSDEISCAIGTLREEMKENTGFIFPAIPFIYDSNIQENEVIISIYGRDVLDEFWIPNKDYVEKEIRKALLYIYRNHLNEIFTIEHLEKYIDKVRKNNFKLVDNITYNLSNVDIKYILVDLLSNGKSIKNITLIFEKIAEGIFIDRSFESNNIKNLSETVLGKI
jgi:flagellar biosynthesis component FlhA